MRKLYGSYTEVIRSGSKLFTDSYIKLTDTHQHLEFSSCHVHHSRKYIPYTQDLRFNRICSGNTFFDNRCNKLECWLKERGYNEKVVRQQILKARKFTREDLLRGKTNLSLILLTIHKPIQNIFYQILTCC